MRQFFSLIFIIAITLGLIMQDADARRFGGGRSFGMNRPSSAYSRTIPSAPAQSNATPNRWLGPLAGLAAGGLLASLFMGNGIGHGLMLWLLIGGGLFLLLQLFRSRVSNPVSSQPMQFNGLKQVFPGQTNMPPVAMNSASLYPAGFDADNFLRNAKVQFIRLQAAYDAKNLADIREFTSPEVFGEIQLQFQERGDALNQTEVVSVDTQLLDVVDEGSFKVATVRFTGMIKEDMNNAAPFNEIWHFRKETSNANWLVAGIEQA
jgi:predicted lipid-binding transport protein (Tim44 family)